jgi:hypothetical protein
MKIIYDTWRGGNEVDIDKALADSSPKDTAAVLNRLIAVLASKNMLSAPEVTQVLFDADVKDAKFWP